MSLDGAISLPPIAAPDVLCIARNDTQTQNDIGELSALFAKHSCLLFPAAFDAHFLDWLMDRADRANFVDDTVERLGTRMIESPQRFGSALMTVLERSNWLEWVERLTGISPLESFAGRLVLHRAGGEDQLDWHDDLISPTRRVAVVINLSRNTYQGGNFEMRRRSEIRPHVSFRHSSPGSMMLFAVRPDLEHRLTPLVSGGPRRTFAGWLLSEPEAL